MPHFSLPPNYPSNHQALAQSYALTATAQMINSPVLLSCNDHPLTTCLQALPPLLYGANEQAVRPISLLHLSDRNLYTRAGELACDVTFALGEPMKLSALVLVVGAPGLPTALLPTHMDLWAGCSPDRLTLLFDNVHLPRTQRAATLSYSLPPRLFHFDRIASSPRRFHTVVRIRLRCRGSNLPSDARLCLGRIEFLGVPAARVPNSTQQPATEAVERQAEVLVAALDRMMPAPGATPASSSAVASPSVPTSPAPSGVFCPACLPTEASSVPPSPTKSLPSSPTSPTASSANKSAMATFKAKVLQLCPRNPRASEASTVSEDRLSLTDALELEVRGKHNIKNLKNSLSVLLMPALHLLFLLLLFCFFNASSSSSSIH
jgi:hypothetical protein